MSRKIGRTYVAPMPPATRRMRSYFEAKWGNFLDEPYGPSILIGGLGFGKGGEDFECVCSGSSK